MSMIIPNAYEIGETVYLKTDPDRLARMVVCIQVSKQDLVYFAVSGERESHHYDFELTKEKNYVEKEV